MWTRTILFLLMLSVEVHGVGLSIPLPGGGTAIHSRQIRTNRNYSAFILSQQSSNSLSLFMYDRAGNTSDLILPGINPAGSSSTSTRGDIGFTTNNHLCFIEAHGNAVTASVWEWQLGSEVPFPTSATLITNFFIGITNADTTAFMIPMRNGSMVAGISCHESGNGQFLLFRYPNGVWTNYGRFSFSEFTGSTFQSTFLSAAEQPIDNSLYMFQTRDGGVAVNVVQFAVTNGLTYVTNGICALNQGGSPDPHNEPYTEICTVMPLSDWASNRIVIAFNNSMSSGFTFDKVTQTSVTAVYTNNVPYAMLSGWYGFGHTVLLYTTNLTNQIYRISSPSMPSLYPTFPGVNPLTLTWEYCDTNNDNGHYFPICRQSFSGGTGAGGVSVIDYEGNLREFNLSFPYNGDLVYSDTNLPTGWHLWIEPSLNVVNYGAVGDCQTIQVDIVNGSAQVTAHSGTPFSASDVGKTVQIFGGDVKATVTAVWGNSPTNFQDRVAIISSFTSPTQVQLDRTLGHTTNGTYMTYGTNNVVAFSNCIAAASSGDTVIIPSGNYLLMNASALDDGFVQSGEFDIGTPSITLSRGSLTFLGDGTNQTILTGNGAWHVKGLQQAFRGTLFKFNSITSNNGPVIFNSIQFNGSASRNHSQLWTGFPAAPTDGSGWDVTHKGIIYASTPTALPLLSITNCLFVHWHGETVEGTDAGTGVVDVGNCGFNDGNATAVNFNGLHAYHDNVCSDYYQFAEDGQFVAGTGTSTIERNIISNIDHGIMIALTGASTNFNGPSYRISRNIFTGTNNYAVTTAGFKNVDISSNQMNGALIGLGVAGSQGTFWNSNIVVYSNTFVGSPQGVLFQGGGINFVESVNISNNVALITGNEYFGEAVLGAGTRYTNITFRGNTANKGVANLDTTGQWFLDDPSNDFAFKPYDDVSAVTNTVTYAYGGRSKLSVSRNNAVFLVDDASPLKIPNGAIMVVSNSGPNATLVYPSSTSIGPTSVNLSANGKTRLMWVTNAWTLIPFTNIAASCSGPDIQAAIAASIPGDTVIVPAGTCDITVSVLLTNQITLLAQGTILRDSIINTGDGANSSIIQVAVGPTPTNITRVTGFKFITGSRATRLFDSGNIHLGGGANNVRIDHCIFNATLNIPIGGGDVFGVVDHNVMDNVGSFTGGPKITHQAYGGSVNGFGAWALPSWTNSYHEDGSALYFEDNFCTNSSGAPGIGFDGFGGTRHVIRHNILDRYIAGDHGTETTAQFAGARLKDVYNNLFVNHGDSEAGHYRSGSGVVTSNTIVNSSGTFTVRNYRMAFGGFYHFANGTNAWDNNDPVIYGSGTATSGGTLTMTDATKTWTTDQWHGFSIRNVNTEQASLVVGNTANTVTYISPTEGSDMAFTPGQAYQFRKIITVLDEVGRGQGTLRNLASPAWPNEVVDPVYCWSNTLDGVTFDMNNGGFYSSVVGQEIVNSPNINWTPYTYPHPLVGNTTPAITITRQPQSTNVFVTQTALFTIAATGTPPLTYQWKTNGVNAGTNGPALSVGPCPIGFSGMSVVCVVANAAGSATSSTATLTVLPDPVITGQPNNATVGVGQVASFSVTATGQSTLQYQWSKNGSSIGGATASNYSTPATVAGDNNSQFSVLVTDNAGSLQSANATLTVTNIPSPPDPVITAQPQSTNIFNNQTASFGITASGATTLHYQWKTNGVNTGTDSSTLALGTCPIAWNGLTVVCVVSDVAGSVTSSIATLTIGADPVISTQPQNVTQFAGSTTSFSVSATGQTALSYQWSRNGSSVAGATQSAYTTPALTMANNGDSYFVDVTDSAGTLRSATATLTVLPQPPTPPTRIAHVTILRVGVTKAGP